VGEIRPAAAAVLAEHAEHAKSEGCLRHLLHFHLSPQALLQLLLVQVTASKGLLLVQVRASCHEQEKVASTQAESDGLGWGPAAA